jgi:hypothetical protein
MYSHSLRSHSMLALMAFGLIVSACGKKSKESLSLEPYRPPVVSENEVFLQKQEIVCESQSLCPEYLAKVVILNGRDKKVCTGFLTDSETVAMTTSCLPEFLRLENQDCSRDVHFFFPKGLTASKSERRTCAKVLKVSDVNNRNPVLWRDDLAFLKLSAPLFRRSLYPSRDGLIHNSNLTMWAVDQIDDFQAMIKRDTCEVVHNSYFNPLGVNEFSPNMIVAGCEFNTGNSGAPLIDSNGLVRAVLSTPTERGLVNYALQSGLLTGTLKATQNVTNFACASTIYDSEFRNDECLKKLDQVALDKARHRMMSFDSIFSPALNAISAELEKSNKFIRFSLSLKQINEDQAVIITPKCFKDVPLWINSISTSKPFKFKSPLPVRKLKKSMDSVGRIRGAETKGNDVDYTFQFSGSVLRANGYANLYMWNNTVDVDLTFNNFSSKCDAFHAIESY